MSPAALALISKLHAIRAQGRTTHLGPNAQASFGATKPENVVLANELVEHGYLLLRDRGPTDNFDLYVTTEKELPVNHSVNA